MPTARSPIHALPTCGAAQALALLSPLGLTENVNDQGGKLSGIKAGQLLPPLQGRKNPAGMTGPLTADRWGWGGVGTKLQGSLLLSGSWPEQGVRDDMDSGCLGELSRRGWNAPQKLLSKCSKKPSLFPISKSQCQQSPEGGLGQGRRAQAAAQSAAAEEGQGPQSWRPPAGRRPPQAPHPAPSPDSVWLSTRGSQAGRAQHCAPSPGCCGFG